MNRKFMVLLIFMLIVPILEVNASSDIIEITSDNKYVYYNGEFKIDIGVNSSNTINNIDGFLEYDKTKLELVEIDTYKGIECSFNDKISCVSKNAVTDGKLFYAIFKSKNTLKVDQNIVISFKKININDGKSKQVDISKNFKVLKDKENIDASLKVLTVNNTSVLSNNTYTTTKDNITIFGVANSNNTTIIGLGNKKLEIGENIFNVVAISESGLKKAYIIKVNRKKLPSEEHKQEIQDAEDKTNNSSNQNTGSNNNSTNQNTGSVNNSDISNIEPEQQLLLTNIEIEGQTLDFNPYKFIYRFSVSSNVSSLNIKTFADEGIDVSIENVEELAFGENIIIINLKKDDKTNKYILYITRKEPPKDNSYETDESLTTNNNDNNWKSNYIPVISFIVIIVLIIVFLITKKKKYKL